MVRFSSSSLRLHGVQQGGEGGGALSVVPKVPSIFPMHFITWVIMKTRLWLDEHLHRKKTEGWGQLQLPRCISPRDILSPRSFVSRWKLKTAMLRKLQGAGLVGAVGESCLWSVWCEQQRLRLSGAFWPIKHVESAMTCWWEKSLWLAVQESRPANKDTYTKRESPLACCCSFHGYTHI